MPDEDLTNIVRIEVPGHSAFQIAHSGDEEGTYRIQLVTPSASSSRLAQALGTHLVLTRSRRGAGPRNRLIVPIGPGVILTMKGAA